MNHFPFLSPSEVGMDVICGIKRSELFTTKLTKNAKYEGHTGCINALSFSPDGGLLLTGSDDATVKIWNALDTSPKCHTTLRGHRTNVFAVTFLNDTSTVISGGNDADIRVYDLEKTKACTVYQHHRKKVVSIKTSPLMPNVFFSSSADGTVKSFDIRCNYKISQITSLEQISTMESAGIEDVDIFSSGILPQSLGGGSLGRVPTDTAEVNKVNLLTFDDTPYTIDISPSNGYHMIVACGDSNTYLFDIRYTGKNYRENYLNVFSDISTGNEVTGASFDCFGKKVVTTCISGYIYMYDIENNFEKDLGVNYFNRQINVNRDSTETYERVFKGHQSEDTIKGVWFWGENSEYIISGSDEGNIFIWDRETGKVLRILEGHNANVNNIAFHPHIPMFVSSGIDSFALSWEPKDVEITSNEMERQRRLIKDAEERAEKGHSYSHPVSRSFLQNVYRILQRQVDLEGLTALSIFLDSDEDEENGRNVNNEETNDEEELDIGDNDDDDDDDDDNDDDNDDDDDDDEEEIEFKY